MNANLYTLADPRTGEVRYVGWTARSLRRRLSEHLKEARHSGRKAYRINWLRSVLADSLLPVIRTVAILDSENEAKRCEVAYIAALRARGCRIVNQTDGGEGTSGRALSTEAKARMDEGYRKHISEIKAKIVEANHRRRGMKQKPRSVSQRAALSESARTSEAAIAHRIEMTERNRGAKRAPFSAEWRAKLAKAGHRRKGEKRKPLSAEHRTKLSEAHCSWWAKKKAANQAANREVDTGSDTIGAMTRRAR